MLRAVILNDTRGDNHFGCFRVMRQIEEHLAERGIRVIGTSLVRNDWEKDKQFLQTMSEADVILINGEGTLHNGARHGERLLKVVDHPARAATPVILINALYQDNPASWGRYLDKMALIATRDSWSAETIQHTTGRPISFVPDLSLGEGLLVDHSVRRDMLLIGDSISRETSRELLKIATSHPNARLLPITRTIKASKPHFAPPLKAMREVYVHLHAALFAMRNRNVLFNRTEDEFIADLRRGYLHVTGRFHSVCFCLFTLTPFLALESNSWKIKALLHDLGLPSNRLLTISEVQRRIMNAESYAYREEEVRAIEAGLDLCKTRTRQLFDEIRRIVETASA
jgi:hypothetical protein